MQAFCQETSTMCKVNLKTLYEIEVRFLPNMEVLSSWRIRIKHFRIHAICSPTEHTVTVALKLLSLNEKQMA